MLNHNFGLRFRGHPSIHERCNKIVITHLIGSYCKNISLGLRPQEIFYNMTQSNVL